MKILKVAVGNSSEAFVENAFSSGLNIISSDENNKGKTIVIQAMMFALGNEPTFPASFDYQHYYYYTEFEEDGKNYRLCRTKDGFVLRQDSSLWIFNSVSEFKRHWNKYISKLPSIVKNQLSRIVDPVLFVQLFFLGQDKKETANIANHGFYTKQDFIEMVFALAGFGIEQLSEARIDEVEKRISKLSDEKRLLLQQHKILKSTHTPVSYLSAESDRLAFDEKVSTLENVQSKITELRKQRNDAIARKLKWEHTIEELRSLNRTISCGELRCMDCNSTNIQFSIGENSHPSYSFDVSSVEMRNEIIRSITEKIEAYEEEIDRLSSAIDAEQEKLQVILSDESISLESIVAYKKDILSASEAQNKLKEIESETISLKNLLRANETASKEMKKKRDDLLRALIEEMNSFHHAVDPSGNTTYANLFTQQNQTYSGSEAIVFHLSRLYALARILHHKYPIVVDSFRAEDLSTTKEEAVLELFKALPNQIIFTTTLKSQELGKYNSRPDVHHIDYTGNTPSKLLSVEAVDSFRSLMESMSVTMREPGQQARKSEATEKV